VHWGCIVHAHSSKFSFLLDQLLLVLVLQTPNPKRLTVMRNSMKLNVFVTASSSLFGKMELRDRASRGMEFARWSQPSIALFGVGDVGDGLRVWSWGPIIGTCSTCSIPTAATTPQLPQPPPALTTQTNQHPHPNPHPKAAHALDVLSVHPEGGGADGLHPLTVEAGAAERLKARQLLAQLGVDVGLLLLVWRCGVDDC